MGRLIDADLLKDNIIKCLKPLDSEEEMIDVDVALVSTLMEIDGQPTAFDVDKTVKELNEKSFFVATSKEFYNNPKNGEYAENVVSLADAIRIVRAEVELNERNSF